MELVRPFVYNQQMRRTDSSGMNAIAFLVALNILAFVFTIFRPALISILGLTPALVPQQPWTLITAMFMHASFTHILFNMISLYFLGSFFLRLVGESDFLWVYFIGGLAGNLLYMLLGPSMIPGVGASGAIFAIGGALAIMAPKLPVIVFPLPIPVPLWGAMIFFLLIGFVISGVAWQAHLGGFLFGMAAGLYFNKRRGRPVYY
ncbi:MAG: rhomboid family intramembrane serine protease [Thermoleophilia bacterium]|nr:rhomboid family intramembrane serine protease [Thermoleophilia bacterium]